MMIYMLCGNHQAVSSHEKEAADTDKSQLMFLVIH